MSSSAFGWYAVDPAQRRRMMEAVDQLRDRTTVDDLGIGGIRDSFSDSLFPGTSTLHTRLRYVLFVPWLMQASTHRDTARQMQLTFRDLEYKFIDALQRGGEAQGVFGRQSGRNLTRLPSVVYWGGIVSWGLVERGMQVHDVFERSVLRREEQKRQPPTEDSESRPELTPTGIDSGLPHPPADLHRSATFALRREDAEYLSEAISRSQPDSLLAHLLTHRPATWTSAASAPETVWDPRIREQLPERLAGLVSRAEKFSFSMLGASLLYNLLVAEEAAGGNKTDDETVQLYRERLDTWSDDARHAPSVTQTERLEIWEMVWGMNRRLNSSTQGFLSTWFDSAHSTRVVADDPALRDLVRGRERQVKGSLARLGNRRALDAWGGASGAGRLEFRWRYARSHLQDIYDGLEAA
ncbi:DUF6361 family protein [Brachybacterium sp. GCM10030268]|uniref:DUF6361 family protein n=1 Tax=Brachybacterium sp. GCM10030268 TaxID=3273382 RepID=UPI0036205F24